MQPLPETEQALSEYLSYGDTDAREELLQMGRAVTSIVPECVGLSLSMIVDGVTFTLVATSQQAAVLDVTQYLDGGPCDDALRHGRSHDVNMVDLVAEKQWVAFARESAAEGVASSLSLPIMDADKVVVGINLYASTEDAFNGHHEQLANVLGAWAAGAVTNADLPFRTRLLALKAPTVLSDRNDVDVAVGLLAATRSVDLPTAEEALVRAAFRAGVTRAQAARVLRHMRLWDDDAP